MRSLAAWRDGIGRVNNAPVLVLGMTAVTFLVALPLSLALRGMIADHLGSSLSAEVATTDTSLEWWHEFQSQATGVGRTLQPSIVGFGAVLENQSAMFDNAPLATTIVGATAAWVVVWSFLSGGILDRLARDRRTRAYGFFAACGVHFWRFLRIGAFAWIVYFALFAWVHEWILGDLYRWLTRDLTVERTAFLVRAGGYLLFGLLLVVVNLIFDYARIRTVVEDRRSAVAAIVAAVRFIRRHVGRVVALYSLNGVAFLLIVVLYALVSTAVPMAGTSIWTAVLLGQAYILARHYLKFVFYASQTALFERALAHAPFTAPPPITWPDSPAAERIANAGPMAFR